VCSISIQHQWPLWITDIATAFLQSDSFEQLSRDSGTELKTVCFVSPKGSEAPFRLLRGYEDIDFGSEVLHLLRPAYGLKDAPKAWKARLNKVLLKLGAKVCPTDASLDLFYSGSELTGVVATHVDDLKGASTFRKREEIFARVSIA
jgi:hypothetical protein